MSSRQTSPAPASPNRDDPALSPNFLAFTITPPTHSRDPSTPDDRPDLADTTPPASPRPASPPTSDLLCPAAASTTDPAHTNLTMATSGMSLAAETRPLETANPPDLGHHIDPLTRRPTPVRLGVPLPKPRTPAALEELRRKRRNDEVELGLAPATSSSAASPSAPAPRSPPPPAPQAARSARSPARWSAAHWLERAHAERSSASSSSCSVSSAPRPSAGPAPAHSRSQLPLGQPARPPTHHSLLPSSSSSSSRPTPLPAPGSARSPSNTPLADPPRVRSRARAPPSQAGQDRFLAEVTRQKRGRRLASADTDSDSGSGEGEGGQDEEDPAHESADEYGYRRSHTFGRDKNPRRDDGQGGVGK